MLMQRCFVLRLATQVFVTERVLIGQGFIVSHVLYSS